MHLYSMQASPVEVIYIAIPNNQKYYVQGLIGDEPLFRNHVKKLLDLAWSLSSLFVIEHPVVNYH